MSDQFKRWGEKMLSKLKNIRLFRRDEDGAVTVDWIVLTAAIVGLAVGGVSALGDASDTLTNNISTELGELPISNGNDDDDG